MPGTMSNLEVHHQEFRSHCGGDSQQNLITLCATCHEQLHRNGKETRLQGLNKFHMQASVAVARKQARLPGCNTRRASCSASSRRNITPNRLVTRSNV